MDILDSFGRRMMRFVDVLGAITLLIIETVREIRHMSKKSLFRQMSHLGVDSIVIVSLTLIFAGAVMTMQVADVMIDYGAQSTVGGSIAIAMGRELGPVLVGVVLAGRVGAAMTAEIGAMSVTEQIDALRVMAVNPIGYLVTPRFLACVLMVPVLAFYGVFLGVLGGYIIAVDLKGIPSSTFINSINMICSLSDLTYGLIKASVFGAVIAIVGCYKGMHTKKDAAGVGQATTSSVVTSIIIIFILNYFLSAILF